MTSTRTGRPRDTNIDKAVLQSVRRHLAVHGMTGLSFAAVAQDAGTTRPALYRRWPTKLELAVAAVADLAEMDPPALSEDPHRDLAAELEHFRHCIMEASALALAGVMLQEDVDGAFKRKYRDHLVKPRRARIRACLERGMDGGYLDEDADLGIAATFATGSLYALVTGGAGIPRDWASRTATLVWRSCGGRVNER